VLTDVHALIATGNEQDWDLHSLSSAEVYDSKDSAKYRESNRQVLEKTQCSSFRPKRTRPLMVTAVVLVANLPTIIGYGYSDTLNC
jgi:hypothetical protein